MQALTYRRDVDGLRAIAVLAVMGYHAFPQWVPGGFVGVDVFFVISGYLITQLLLRDLQQQTFSLPAFYARRVRRIFPALILVLAAVLLLAWLILLGGEFRYVGKHVAAGATFSSNFLLASERGYFDHAASEKPLIHLWSLAIEEQFYIVWPLLLWIAWKLRMKLAWLMLLLAALSFYSSVTTLAASRESAFYLPLSRAWELAVGGLLAASTISPGKLVRSGITLAGPLCILAAFVLFDGTQPYPGVRALLPVVGTALVILAGPGAWANRILSVPPLVACGLISFPLYLWHWPLLCIEHLVRGPDRHTPYSVRMAILLVSAGLAALTYRLVERRMRFGGRLPQKAVALCIAMAAVGCAGFAAAHGYIHARASAHGADILDVALADWQFPGTDFQPIPVGKREFYGAGSGHGTVWYFGDSHMEQYGPRIGQLIAADPSRYPKAIFTTQGGCPPIANVQAVLRKPFCDGFFDLALQYGRSLHASSVVIGAAWHYYLSSRLYVYRGPTSPYQELEEMISSFRAAGMRVYLVLETPNGPQTAPEAVLQRHFLSFQQVPRVLRISDLPAEWGAITARLREIAARTGSQIIDPMEGLCKDGVCPATQENGEPRYRDLDHLRASFVREHATFMDRTLTDALEAQPGNIPSGSNQGRGATSVGH